MHLFINKYSRLIYDITNLGDILYLELTHLHIMMQYVFEDVINFL